MPTRSSTAPPTLLRRDAERNRQRILDVAGEVFAAQGLAASMNDIAAAAGVGVGTVYRRFPERDSLIRGVFEQRIAGLERLALEARAHPDPWDGIVWFFEQVLALEAVDRGLAQLLQNETLRRSLVGRADALRSSLRALVVRAQEAGQLRTDVGVGDFLVLRGMLTDAAVATRSVRPDHWRRMLALCLDGLRAPGATPLPGTALTVQEIQGLTDVRPPHLRAEGQERPPSTADGARPRARRPARDLPP